MKKKGDLVTQNIKQKAEMVAIIAMIVLRMLLLTPIASGLVLGLLLMGVGLALESVTALV